MADIRKMGIISLDSQNWVVNTLLPGMFEHLKGKPLYHAQLIDPQEVMAKVSGTNIKSKAADDGAGFQVLQFYDETELNKYLNSIQ